MFDVLYDTVSFDCTILYCSTQGTGLEYECDHAT